MHLGVVGGLIIFSLGLRGIATNLTGSHFGYLGPLLTPLWAASLTIGLALYWATTAMMWITLRHKLPVSYFILTILTIAATPLLVDRPALPALAILIATAIIFLLVGPSDNSQPFAAEAS
jgi:hypothetical protein